MILDDGLIATIGDYDVPTSFTNAGLDRKGHRAPPERGVHMAEPVPRLQRTSEEF